MSYLFVLIIGISALIAFAEEPNLEEGQYHYPYQGTEIFCKDLQTWRKGAARSKLLIDKKPVPCSIVDPSTGKTEFGVRPQIVVFIRAKQ